MACSSSSSPKDKKPFPTAEALLAQAFSTEEYIRLYRQHYFGIKPKTKEEKAEHDENMDRMVMSTRLLLLGHRHMRGRIESSGGFERRLG